jgi:hypothetical protein
MTLVAPTARTAILRTVFDWERRTKDDMDMVKGAKEGRVGILYIV